MHFPLPYKLMSSHYIKSPLYLIYALYTFLRFHISAFTFICRGVL